MPRVRPVRVEIWLTVTTSPSVTGIPLLANVWVTTFKVPLASVRRTNPPRSPTEALKAAPPTGSGRRTPIGAPNGGAIAVTARTSWQIAGRDVSAAAITGSVTAVGSLTIEWVSGGTGSVDSGTDPDLCWAGGGARVDVRTGVSGRVEGSAMRGGRTPVVSSVDEE